MGEVDSSPDVEGIMSVVGQKKGVVDSMKNNIIEHVGSRSAARNCIREQMHS